MELFGIEIKRKKAEDNIPAIAPPVPDDGSIMSAAGGVYGSTLDLDGAVKSEAELITKYREAAQSPELQTAITKIIDEAIVDDQDETVVKLVLDKLDYSDEFKRKIETEFNTVLDLLEFNKYPYKIFENWYIDGRLYYHIMVDVKNPRDGIKELRYLDPRKIRKIREVKSRKTGSGVTTKEVVNEYYIYNDRAATIGKMSAGSPMSQTAIKIAKDSILYITSGLTNPTGNLVISYLQKALRPLNQLRSLEDSLVIYRISRAPERRIFYIDVGNLPKSKAEQYVRDLMVRFKNKLVYDAGTGEIKDDRKFMCYALDTKIPLLDGRTLKIADIIKEYEQGKENWVYSCDPTTGKFVPGPVSWAGITKQSSDVVKVTFDNGKSVVCTPDHKFPVWNKGFVEAQHLTAGTSLIPGYRRTKEITPGGAKYEQIFKNDTKSWEFTHREVVKFKEDIDMQEFAVNDIKYIDSKKGVIHHRNFNRFDNTPNNLVLMNHKDHLEYHRSIQNIEYTPEIFDILNDCAIQQMDIEETVLCVNAKIDLGIWRSINSKKNPKNRNVETLVFTTKDLKRLSIVNGFNGWKSYCQHLDFSTKEANGRTSRGLVIRGSNEWKHALSNAAKNRTPKSKSWKIVSPTGEEEIIENLSAYCRDAGLDRNNIKRSYGSKGFKAEELHNHKVVSVEFLDEKIPVAALTIDQEETYHSHHTYLLDAGVYTKNTMLEDFWLPRREGGKGTEITTLPGGCFAMDTKVSLLDGRGLSIREIENEMAEGKTLWTYSCDQFTGEIKPGLISWAGVTHKSAKVMKITLDNGKDIICTPDHEFPIFDRGFVEAKDLVVGESLIPLYRKNEKITVNKNSTYEMVFDNADKEWKFTHRLVAQALRDEFVFDFIFQDQDEVRSTVHHIDFNRYNNSPENLCYMGSKDHMKYHASQAGFKPEYQKLGTIAAKQKLEKMKNEDPDAYEVFCSEIGSRFKTWHENLTEEEKIEYLAKTSSGNQKYWGNLTAEERGKRNVISRHNLLQGSMAYAQMLKDDPLFFKKISDIRKESWRNKERRENASLAFSNISKELWHGENSIEHRNRHRENQKIVIDEYILKFIIDCVHGKTTHQVTRLDVLEMINEDEDCVNRLISLNKDKNVPNWKPEYGFTYNILGKCVTQFGYKNWADFRKKESLYNHRITNIEYLDDEIEVGTLTIDANELIHNHHTFALSAGVFTKNSNLSQIDDIIYFQKNLYKALNVPVTRLDPEVNYNLGRSSEISREEIEFSKFITRLRSQFANLFTKALGTQLMLKNIVTPEDWDQIEGKIGYRFNKDNFWEELKESEILRDRLDILRTIEDFAGKYYSHKWIRTNILRQTEEEMKTMDDEITEELDNPQFNPPVEAPQGQEEPGAEQDQQIDSTPNPNQQGN